MRTGFVNEAVLTFLGYVGVPLDAESIDTAVDAYIRSGCRGFTIRWFTNGVMHGVTLSPTTGMESFCVVIADEIGSDPDVVAARRVVTLLHEFAHFLPRYNTLKRGNVVYRTPEKAKNFEDSPGAGVAKGGGRHVGKDPLQEGSQHYHRRERSPRVVMERRRTIVHPK